MLNFSRFITIILLSIDVGFNKVLRSIESLGI